MVIRGIYMVNLRVFVVVFLLTGMLFLVLPVQAQEVKGSTQTVDAESLNMLGSIVELKQNLQQRIVDKQQAISASISETEKNNLAAELDRLDKMLASANQDFERIATGVDTSLFAEKNPSSLTGKMNWYLW